MPFYDNLLFLSHSVLLIHSQTQVPFSRSEMELVLVEPARSVECVPIVHVGLWGLYAPTYIILKIILESVYRVKTQIPLSNYIYW